MATTLKTLVGVVALILFGWVVTEYAGLNILIERASDENEVVATSPSATAAAETSAVVERVVDGDTISVSIGGQSHLVRLIGIDAPEMNYGQTPECYAAEATAYLDSLLDNSTVQLVSDVSAVDKYNRLLRYVYVDDIFVNEQLVAKGYARARRYYPDTAQAPVLEAAAETARDSAVGLWSACRE